MEVSHFRHRSELDTRRPRTKFLLRRRRGTIFSLGKAPETFNELQGIPCKFTVNPKSHTQNHANIPLTCKNISYKYTHLFLYYIFALHIGCEHTKKGERGYSSIESTFLSFRIWYGWTCSLETRRGRWECFTCCKVFSKYYETTMRVVIVQSVKHWAMNHSRGAELPVLFEPLKEMLE